MPSNNDESWHFDIAVSKQIIPKTINSRLVHEAAILYAAEKNFNVTMSEMRVGGMSR